MKFPYAEAVQYRQVFQAQHRRLHVPHTVALGVSRAYGLSDGLLTVARFHEL